MAATSHSLESLLRRSSSLSHFKQLHAHLLTNGLFQSLPSFRVKLIESCSLSFAAADAAGDLSYSAALLAAVRRPTTNDYNALLRGLAASPLPRHALSLFSDLLRRSPPRPDALSLSFTLKAAARLCAAEESSQIHSHIIQLGFHPDVRLITTLVDAYAKSGHVDDAERVFDEMTIRDVATWNALVSGFAQSNRPHDALAIFNRMRSQESPERPNEITLIAGLSACSQLGSLREGEAAHEFARAENLDRSIEVCNALVDMYAKCGSLDRSLQVFHSVANKTLVTWNSAIMGLAMHGRGSHALQLFDEMSAVALRGGTQPDKVTYLAVLCGCVHAGLVDDGLRVFHSMQVRPTIKHYGCVVDLLGRAGRLSEAYDVVLSMEKNVEPDIVLWQTLLGACKAHGDIGLAEMVSQKLSKMGSNACGDYVLLSNVYAAKRRWSDVDRVREDMKRNDVRKVPGFSFMEIDGVVHKFVNGDREHERWREIYDKLEEMAAKIHGLGYAPETESVLHDIGDEDKEWALYQHSEKLALAFGLLSTSVEAEIHIIKNLTICGDCHVVAKLVSKAYGRVIVIRDRGRFHRFDMGNCSCGDYW